MIGSFYDYLVIWWRYVYIHKTVFNTYQILVSLNQQAAKCMTLQFVLCLDNNSNASFYFKFNNIYVWNVQYAYLYAAVRLLLTNHYQFGYPLYKCFCLEGKGRNFIIHLMWCPRLCIRFRISSVCRNNPLNQKQAYYTCATINNKNYTS